MIDSDYNFKKIHITDLHNYRFKKGNFHYVAEDVDFYFKNNKGSNLVVFFHGASLPHQKSIIFRGYNYDFETTDILCLSDRLLKLYYSKGLQLSWYLSTPEYDNFNLYKKILDKILSNNYNKIIFTGTSGGGYPALIFSSFYSGICLISNSQIYLEKYHYFAKMMTILNINPRDISKYHIEKFMLTYGFPKQIILYTNIRDVSHYKEHSLPFYDFINMNTSNTPNTQKIEFISFFGNDPLNTSHHMVRFPNLTYNEIIANLLRD